MPADVRPAGTGAPLPSPALTAVLTAAAMLAFAANSLLCRAALAGGHADAASFTTLRLASGALGARPRWRGPAGAPRRPRASPGARPLALFAYAIGFSLAYLRIPAGPARCCSSPPSSSR